jgi:hypothetical protein
LLHQYSRSPARLTNSRSGSKEYSIGKAEVHEREAGAADGRSGELHAALSATICYHHAIVARMKLEQAYPDIAFRWRSRNWWARLSRVPPECVHLENDGAWMATFVPDTLYLCGKASVLRQPARPEASLCRACLVSELEKELSQYHGRVVAFEPDAAFTQYFFVGAPEFSDAGLQPEVAAAITRRLELPVGDCEQCERRATWLWISHEQVPSLDETGRIAMASGEALCAKHGAHKLCEAFARIGEANLFYVNVPYGDAGVYLWI